jgi:anti-sigma-K factor RskA
MDGMPMPPKGHVYQAWTQHVGAQKMAPSITFMPDRSGVALVSLPMNASAIAAVAVSVEPEGGSKAPTTKPEFVVKLT